MTRDSRVGAIVFGGDTTIDRFKRKGFFNTWRIDLEDDLGISDPNAGVETLQRELTRETAVKITNTREKFDLLVIRHVLEHAHNLNSFFQAIRELARPNAYVVFEVPDCEKPFLNWDYSILWEEHVFYFTPATLRLCLEAYGFEVLKIDQPTYSLVATSRVTEKTPSEIAIPRQLLQQELNRTKQFALAFPKQQKKICSFLKQSQAKEGRIAFFGAGHLACTYINVLHLKKHIECVIDDHPQKCGMFMPGSRLPILSSAALIERKIKICLSTLSPETERKVASKNPAFLATGGRFLSIFRGRYNSLPA
jgi:SAM-dependent methyltransferase